MCDTAKCAACRPEKKASVVGQLLIGMVEVAGVAAWWLLRRVVAPGLVVLGWAAYVWLTGAQWRQAIDHRYLRRSIAPRHRLVRREVRATGQIFLTVVAALLLWQPVLIATVLTITGGGLVVTALGIRNRERLLELVAGRRQLDRAPIRVQAEVGTPRRLTRGGGR